MFTKNFTEITKEDTNIAGGKGASLGEMTGAGIPIPPGFVILTYGFDCLLHSNQLVSEIDSALHGVNHEDANSVEQASEKIKGLILNAKIPPDLETEILNAFENLNCEFVAVRSSATAEDGSSTSWAGELESFLNTTKETLLENVKKCWSSLFTPRAIFYRFEKKLHETPVSVAVVIQKMVNSEVSGVAFSVHPVTEDRNQLIIEAGLGLGEAIVSGSLTPDSYIIDKQDFSIIDISIAEQERKMVKKINGGNEWIDVPESERSLQKLNPEQIIELARLVVQIENHYGFPVDVEWAKEQKRFFITQSRPITTLTSRP
ncbi:MAG: Uncharacterized protein G01um10147_357 [Microgenomates group bacterium Gr01-1014_7]|nr:MAG: Uncharacterized protein G01um10147_357 [Microgenomates group bacterium Gr01-1014_7]